MIFFVPPKDGCNIMVLLSPVTLCMIFAVLIDGRGASNGQFHSSRVVLIFASKLYWCCAWCPFILFIPWDSHCSTGFSSWNVVLLDMEKTRTPVMGSFTALNYTRKKKLVEKGADKVQAPFSKSVPGVKPQLLHKLMPPQMSLSIEGQNFAEIKIQQF